MAVGLEQNRLAFIVCGIASSWWIANVGSRCFVNVVGGVKVGETGADLALLLALISSFRNRPLPQDLVVFGEVGLAGEIRPVTSGQERISEAAKHGFKRAIVPLPTSRKVRSKIWKFYGEKLSDALAILDNF